MFTGLRWGLHALVAVLTVLVAVGAVLGPAPTAVALTLTLVFATTYAAGAWVARPERRRWAHVWLAVLVLEWVALLWVVSEAAYLVFPLFFLFLHLLRGAAGVVAVLLATAVTVVGLGLRGGWSVGGTVGPLVGAGVALLIGLGYASLAREAVERDRLVAELLATRDRLAASEHESGVLAERSRLARDLHDTVAQSLSSIQMLLHAAERADPDRPGVEHVRLARDTAAASLTDTRRFIRNLTPAPLDDRGLGAAVERLADTQWRTTGLRVVTRIDDRLDLPMHVQTALLRIVQGAMANVVQHARADEATIELTAQGSRARLVVSDDGRGFDPDAVARAAPAGTRDSFGLTATRQRVEALGGTMQVRSAPAAGTTLTVEVEVPAP